VPIVIAASTDGLDAAKGTYQRLLAHTVTQYAESFGYYRRLRDELTSIDTPDDRLDLAFEWGKVASTRGSCATRTWAAASSRASGRRERASGRGSGGTSAATRSSIRGR
jgi:hypothetical protein